MTPCEPDDTDGEGRADDIDEEHNEAIHPEDGSEQGSRMALSK
jgi:hypothetical protein